MSVVQMKSMPCTNFHAHGLMAAVTAISFFFCFRVPLYVNVKVCGSPHNIQATVMCTVTTVFNVPLSECLCVVLSLCDCFRFIAITVSVGITRQLKLTQQTFNLKWRSMVSVVCVPAVLLSLPCQHVCWHGCLLSGQLLLGNCPMGVKLKFTGWFFFCNLAKSSPAVVGHVCQ